MLLIAGTLFAGMVAHASPAKGAEFKAAQVQGLNVVARATPYVLQGLSNQKAGGITIAESTMTALPDADVWLRVSAPVGVSFEDTPLAQRISGNIEVGAAQAVDGWIRIPVSETDATPTLSSIGITNIRYDVATAAAEATVTVQVYSSETTPTIGDTTTAVLLGKVDNAVVVNSVPVVFPDVPGRHFAAAAILMLHHMDIIHGYPDGMFRPGANISRAEFTKMIIESREISLVDTPTAAPFPDVPVTHWAVRYIDAAKRSGLVTGYPDGSFRPQDDISRAEIATLVVRAGGFVSLTGGPGFSDVPTTHWAFSNIMTARNHGLVLGYPDNTFRPNNPATRAESAMMIFNWLTDR